EDPIEYQVAGVNQVQVDERSKKTFGAILRAMLRQDPDVMMIGEVRDSETAQIAFRASITGHLVLSTVHTNDAPSAVTRLVDLGLQPYMVASSLVAVVSMRLIRLLCPKCKDGYVPSGDELRLLGIAQRDARDLVLYRPVGCDLCGESGYKGRTGVYEILEMEDTVRRLVAGNATETLIRRAAMEAGMTTIGQDGLARVLAGETSLEEVQRVVYYEEELGHVCASCRQTVAPDHVYCPHCGTPSSGSCTSCGRRVDPEWGYCPSCGGRRAQVMGPEPPHEDVVVGDAIAALEEARATEASRRPPVAPRGPERTRRA
ncbi:MAG TPA: ATPase, T2SS/T4P/T4SS family, partial [Candidatus Eisenbacteria bacterium]|nr:ATPase, T2SS/T4P/T4SS family [Candidatus Eisenbacteria bacterium]